MLDGPGGSEVRRVRPAGGRLFALPEAPWPGMASRDVAVLGRRRVYVASTTTPRHVPEPVDIAGVIGIPPSQRPPVRGLSSASSLGANWGFTAAKDRNQRISRIRNCRKSFRISVHSGFDSQALPPAFAHLPARHFPQVSFGWASHPPAKAVAPKPAAPMENALSDQPSGGKSKSETQAPATAGTGPRRAASQKKWRRAFPVYESAGASRKHHMTTSISLISRLT